MKVKTFFRNSIISLYNSLRRFPISIVLASLGSILLIILSHYNQRFSSDTDELLGRVAMTLFLGVPISLSTKLIYERKPDTNMFTKLSVYIVEALMLLLYFLFLLKDFEMVPITRYIALNISFYLCFVFIPYFFRRTGFELYVIKLITRFFVTIIYSVVLFLGIAAILFTVDKLLGIHVSEKLYLDVFISIAGIFAPCFFLAGIPSYESHQEANNYPKLLNVLLLYIVMPIITVYTAILYIYFAKIIIVLQWPEGMVSHLVLWYSVICAMNIFLITPLADKSAWVRSFIFLLPKLVIPLIIMMFVSIGIRVNAYGVTENRYFVILLGLWAFGIMIYLNLDKTKRNIVLVLSLSIIAFLSVVGPWSSYSISKFSQNKRFENILTKYNMINDNMLIKSKKQVSDVDKKEISQILSYFSRSHKLTDVKYLPKEFKMEQMESVFGFPNSEYEYIPNRNEFSYSSDVLSKSIEVKDYSYMLLIRSFDSTATKLSDNLEIRYDNSTHELRFVSDNSELIKVSVSDYANQIYKKYGANNKYNIDPNKIAFVDENENIKVKIIFQNVYANKDEKYSNGIYINSLEFFVLVNLK